MEQPYNWLLSQTLRANGVIVEEFTPRAVLSGPDIWHLHWPDALLNDTNQSRTLRNLVGLIGLIRIARRRGVSIAWTVHNLQTHERLYPRLEAWFWRTITPLLDGYICLSESSRQAALERFPALETRPGFVIPLGHYRGIYPDTVTSDDARRSLDLGPDDRVLAFIGQIRPYKGVLELIKRFQAIEDPSARLVIAGRPNTETLASEVHAAAADDRRIRLRLRFLADDEIQIVLRAADVVTLPFVEILNSASAMLALSFDRPVLVPKRGSMAELQSHLGDRWVRVYEGPLTSTELALAVEWATGSPSDRAPLDAFAWSRVGELTTSAYRAIVASRRNVR